jgi:putative colanic acid biosynthesis acetyltransferase WcaF
MKVNMSRNLSKFRNSSQIIVKIRIQHFLWFYLLQPIFRSKINFSFFRRSLLKLMGARVGKRVIIRNNVKVHFPWNLSIGDDCWIGEEVWFISHEKITIGSNVCISQRSIVCSGGHDYRSAALEYAHKPVEIKDGAWVCLDAKVLPGVTIGECSVVSAGEVARNSLPDYSMLVGGQVRPIDLPK